MKKQALGGTYRKRVKRRRKGVHSKNRKPAKRYRGQGKVK